MSNRLKSIRPLRSTRPSIRRTILRAAIKPLLEMLEKRSHFSVAPVAHAGGVYTVAEGQSVLISGLTSTDSDGSVVSYQWDTNYNAVKGFKNRLSGGTWTFNADVSGSRQIALRVVDNSGDVSSVSTATINISDVAPTLTLTAPSTANEGTSVQANWSYTDPAAADVVTGWNIDWGDGTTANYAGSVTGGAHVYDEDGSYSVVLTATQANNGLQTSVTHALTVNNVTPIVTATTTTPTLDEGEIAQVDFTAPNRAGTLDGWTIDWGDGSSDQYTTARSHATHVYVDNGNYTAVVAAQEPDGGQGTANVQYTINNVAPDVAQTGLSTTGTEGTAITAGSTVTDAGINDTETYGWTVYRDGQHFNLPGGTTLNGHSFTFTPTDNGSYVVRLTVIDNDGGSTTVDSAAIAVANVSPTATITGTPGSAINEGDLVSLTANPADAGSEDTFSYAWSVTKDGSAFALPNGADTTHAGFSFTPTDNGSYMATVIVSDDDGGTVSVSTAAITANNVNPTATITGTPTTSAEGSPVTVIAVPADAGSADTFGYGWSVTKDGVAYSLANVAHHGSTLTFSPNDNGTYVINLTVTDDDGGTVSVNSSAITVTNVAPTGVITGDASGTEGGALNYSVAVTDPGTVDTQSYLWTVTKGGVSYNLNGATANASTFSFTPDDNAAYVVSVAITDKDGGTTTATQNVTVANAAPAVAITGTPAGGPEGTAITLGSTVTDAGINDTETYGWTVYRDGQHFNLPGGTTLNGHSFTFTPTDNGSYVARLTVVDNDSGSTTVNSSAMVITNVNPTATITGTPGSAINEGAAVGLTAVPADAGSEDTFTYAWSVTKDGNAYTLPNGTDVNSAAFNFTTVDNGSYIATVVVSDDDSGSVTVHSSAITVNNVAPTASITGAPASSAEGTAIGVSAVAQDIGVLDTFGYGWTVTKDGVAVDLSAVPHHGSTFNFTPPDNGSYVIGLTVTDNDGGTVSVNSSAITVTNVAPTGVITGDASGTEGGALNYSVAVTDPGTVDTQTYLWTVTKGGVSYNLNGATDNANSFSFTPDDNAAYVVSVAITDKDGGMSTATQNVTVANAAPVAAITGAPGTSPEGTAITLGSTSSDAGAADMTAGLTYAWTVMKDGAVYATSTTATNQGFVFTPSDNGSYVVSLAVTDKDSATTSVSTAAIVVTNVAPTGTITGEPGSAINEGDSIALTAAGSDVGTADAASLTYAWTIKKDGASWTPLSGTVLNVATLSFVPTDNGSYVATAVITDKDGGHVSVNSQAIVANNVPPVAVITGAPATGTEGSAISVGSTVTDAGVADTQTYAWSVTKGGVAVDLSSVTTNSLSFAFTPRDNGAYVVSLAVTDDDGGTTTTTAAITVNNAPPVPVITSNSSVNEDHAISLSVAANDPGVDDTQTYLWSVTKGGVAYTTGLGATNTSSFSFTPNLFGTYVVSAVVTDNDGGTATATKTITVNNVAPTASITGLPGGPRGEGSPITLHGVAADVSGETGLTYAWSVTRNNGQTFTLPGGTVTNTQDFSFIPTHSGLYRVTLAVTDSGGLTTTSTTSNIVVTNALPAATLTGAPGAPITEGTAVTLHVTAADPGAEDVLNYAWSVIKNGQAFALPNGTSTNATSFTFTPNDNGTWVASCVVTDDDGGPTTVTSGAMTVTNVAPTITAINRQFSTDPILEGDTNYYMPTVTDPGTADTFTYAWTATKNNVAYNLGSSANQQQLHFVPDDQGTYVLSLTVTDKDGGTATLATGSITVGNANPVLSSDAVLTTGPAYGTDEGDKIGLSALASDPGVNDQLTYTWTILKPDATTTTLVGNNLEYTLPDNGNYYIRVAVTDQDGGSKNGVTHYVNVANLAPYPTNISVPTTGTEGSPITSTVTATDVAADTISYAWSVKRNNQTVALPNGTTSASSFTFTPTDSGSYVVSITTSDEDGGTVTNVRTVAVANVAPVAAISGDTIGTEGSPVTVTASATDVSSDDTTAGFTYAWSVTKNGLSYTLPQGTLTNAATLTWTPANDGTYTGSVTATDKDGAHSTATHNVVISNVAPTATLTGVPTTGVEGTAITIGATATDPGTEDTIQYSWVVEKDGQAYLPASDLSSSTSAFAFTPTDNGSYVVKLYVTDGVSGNFYDTSAITVSNVAPSATIAGVTTSNEGSPVTMTATGTDAGSDDVSSLAYAWSVTKDGTAVDLTGLATTSAAFTYTPADQGGYVFSVLVTDKDGGHSTLTHSVAVANVAPVASITGAPSTGLEGTAITVGSTATDAGVNDALTYGWTVYKDGQHYTLPNSTTITGTGLTFTPTDNGSYVVRLTVADQDGGSTTINSSAITVANVAPTAAITGDTTGTEGHAVSLGSTASDAGSDDLSAGLTYAWTARRGNTVVATGAAASFSFTPGVHGTYAITLAVTDKDGATTTKTSSIVVANVAPTNVALAGSLAGITEGDSVALTASANDAPRDTLSYTWQVLNGDNVFASGTGADVDFTAARGDYQIVVTATDSANATATRSYDLTVANAAPTGTLTPQTGSSLLSSGINFGVNIGDVPSSQALSVVWDFGDGTTSSGNYTGDQLVTKKHVYAAHGTYTVSAAISDSVATTTVTQTVTVSEAAMIVDPADSTKTALLVLGGDANDTIAVSQQSNGKYGVTFNGDVLGTNYAPTGRVYVYGNGGANNITVTGTANAFVFAGAAGSTVTTGAGNDIIIGSAGADRLSGGAGRDIIIGGAGSDTLHGGDGDDLLIAQSAAKMNNIAAMTTAMSTWANPNLGLASRRTALTSVFGSKALIADAGGNQLFGDAGNEWLVFNPAADKLKDLQSSDLLN